MVTVVFKEEPSKEEVSGFIDRVQKKSTTPRGLAGRVLFDFDDEDLVLNLDWDAFRRVVIEHQQFEAAQGFTATEAEILRAIEDGPDRTTLDEIREEVDAADSTIHKYTTRLQEKGLIRNDSRNVYEYTGP